MVEPREAPERGEDGAEGMGDARGMETRDGTGELEDLGAPAVDGGAGGDRTWERGAVDGDDAGAARVFAVGSTEVATVRVGVGEDRPSPGVRVGTEVTFAKQVGVFSAMVVFWIGTLIPAVLFGWAGFALAADSVAATAILHAHGLEPRTLGPAFLIGLSLAVVLLLVRWNRKPPLPHLPSPWTARYPALKTIIAMAALSAVTTAAASTGSPFFPYPLATVLVVATFAFTVVISLVATVRWLVGSMRRLYQWSCRGHYRAGFVTALLLVLGGAGVWAQYAGRMSWPARWLAREVELDAVHGPTGLGDLGRKALCLAAGEIEPGKARSAAAPACSFLPGTPIASHDCFVAIMDGPYWKAIAVLKHRYDFERARDAASQAIVDVCQKERVVKNLGGLFFKAAENRAKQSLRKDGPYVPCGDEDKLGATCALSLDEDTIEQLEAQVLCHLRGVERDIFEMWLTGRRYREIGAVLGMTERQAKDTLNNALKRIKRVRAADPNAPCAE